MALFFKQGDFKNNFGIGFIISTLRTITPKKPKITLGFIFFNNSNNQLN